MASGFDNVIESISKAVIIAEQTAMIEAEVSLKQRIHTFGKKADGSKIGNYSTRPFKKPDNSAFITQEAINKLKGYGVVSGGYKQFRELNGLQSQYVDLYFKGDLFKGYGAGTFQGRNVVGITTQREKEKFLKLNNKYPGTFKLSKSEGKRVLEVYKKQFNDTLNEVYRSRKLVE